jgi:hypothetical protein
MSDDIVARLRYYTQVDTTSPVFIVNADLLKAADEIERLRAERDEARREVCQLKGTVRWNHYFPHFDPKGYAKNRGWDCHKDYK